MKIYVVTCDLTISKARAVTSDSKISTTRVSITQEDIFVGIAQSLLEAKNVIERNVPNGYRIVWPSDGWTFNYESCSNDGRRAFKIREIEMFDSESKYEDLKKIKTLETEVSDLKKKIEELKSRLNALHGFDSGSKYTTKSFKEDSDHVEF